MSLHATMVELLGYDPDSPPVARESVAVVAKLLGHGQVAPAQHHGEQVAVARLADGRLFVLADSCPHDGGTLSDGFVDDDHIVCVRHGRRIDPCAGSCPGLLGNASTT